MAVAMSKPAIIFIPASYVLLPVYQPLFNAVSEADYEIKGIHLATIGLRSRQGRDGAAPSMYDDAAMIAREVENFADQGKDVILMGHSYAGIPISQSTEGLGKDERKAQGKVGGIIQLAYISCLVPAVGYSAGSLLSRFPNERRPLTSVDENGWMLAEDPAATAGMICQRLPLKEGEEVVRNFAKHSAQSFGNELTYAGYEKIAASYLLCQEDLAGPPEFQREMIAMIEEASGRKVDVTSILADHFPSLSAEKETIKWILKVVKKSSEYQQTTLATY